MKEFIAKYFLYLFRWQLSTPLLTFVLAFLGNGLFGVVIGNLIGGLLFFWVDKKILEEKKDKLFQKYAMYLFRWQLTSLTMYPIVTIFGGELFGVFIANFIGGIIFFWVDRWIFTGKTVPVLWEVKENVLCFDCKKNSLRGYRIVLAPDYDRRNYANPEFRCEKCSIKKTNSLREKGIKV